MEKGMDGGLSQGSQGNEAQGGEVAGGMGKPEVREVPTKKKGMRWYGWVILVLVLGMIVEAGGIVYLLMKDNDLSEVVDGGQDDEDKDETENEEPDEEKPEEKPSKDEVAGGKNEEKEDSTQYVYVGEWGKKFKIPEGLKAVSYRFEAWDESAQVLCVTGTPNEVTGEPKFTTYLEPGLGCLVRYSKELENTNKETYDSLIEGGLEFDSDGYAYMYHGLQSALTTDEQEMKWEIKAVQLVHDMLVERIDF